MTLNHTIQLIKFQRRNRSPKQITQASAIKIHEFPQTHQFATFYQLQYWCIRLGERPPQTSFPSLVYFNPIGMASFPSLVYFNPIGMTSSPFLVYFNPIEMENVAIRKSTSHFNHNQSLIHLIQFGSIPIFCIIITLKVHTEPFSIKINSLKTFLN